ncbi:hypothetical protein F9C07_1858 [Aspergillus flavus]|uniref:Uncharacterized protein n=1 Tax=Aspergillus flavus (strain ATCC 200026 / FGSC A1120 / IAM 13836 / NRRL 3357 / JCM 12722 / SRRC 167) TaxID=332952 RepID=A0A7U2MGE4_ASPFN|nr:hypothetical protein F9C07_1858 [Aspergillus flavus]
MVQWLHKDVRRGLGSCASDAKASKNIEHPGPCNGRSTAPSLKYVADEERRLQ